MAAPFNLKARKWVDGRKEWYRSLEKTLPPGGADIWMHCASLGEFEQGRPVLENLRRNHPEKYILLTFFSPSGYEVRKNYANANHICYLPLDTRENAYRLTLLVKPRLVIFVKYEFWFHLLKVLDERRIPVLLISAIFRPDQFFFRWYGKPFRKSLVYYKKIFVQDKHSAGLLQKAGVTGAVVAGDTRFDRVIGVAGHPRELPALEAFLQGDRPWVAGSTWLHDEELIRACHRPISKWIIAPHEVTATRLLQIEKIFPGKTVRYSTLLAAPEKFLQQTILLVDNVGMLSSLYRYGAVAYVGGGFDHGIHNILEAAVYGVPVVFGPKYHKFKEAVDLIGIGGAFTVSDEKDLEKVMIKLTEAHQREAAGRSGSDYVRAHAGATEKIIRYIQEKRFLTR
jgi:3-deoxy-D-manno-octulosonic-acid transferase